MKTFSGKKKIINVENLLFNNLTKKWLSTSVYKSYRSKIYSDFKIRNMLFPIDSLPLLLPCQLK